MQNSSAQHGIEDMAWRAVARADTFSALASVTYSDAKYMYHGTIQVPWYPMYQYDSIEPRFARVHERL